MEEVKITTEALDFILQASRNTFPNEFAGLLRKNKKGELAVVLVIPQTTYGRDYSSMNLYNVPYTSHHCGSVHSHTSTNPSPSRADLAFFKATGDLHLIVAYPFTPDSIRAYDRDGKGLALKVA